MSDLYQQSLEKMRRSITQEFIQMEDVFDNTADQRKIITDKLMGVVDKLVLTDDQGNTKEETPVALGVLNTALKALSDTEKAKEKALSLKLRHSEAEAANAAEAKERIEIVIKATAPGRIEQTFPQEQLENVLEEMFDSQIKDSELKTSPRDLEA